MKKPPFAQLRGQGLEKRLVPLVFRSIPVLEIFSARPRTHAAAELALGFKTQDEPLAILLLRQKRQEAFTAAFVYARPNPMPVVALALFDWTAI